MKQNLFALLGLVTVFALAAPPQASAQVAIGIGIGPYGYVAPAPYPYYGCDYYPYYFLVEAGVTAIVEVVTAIMAVTAIGEADTLHAASAVGTAAASTAK